MSDLYINEILFLQLIGSFWLVIGLGITVVSSCKYCGKCMKVYVSVFRNRLILTAVVDVIVGR